MAVENKEREEEEESKVRMNEREGSKKGANKNMYAKSFHL